ncbi:MAG TPA: hypothetical protein VIQ25_05515 [Gemmatimonadales bacterium]
MTMRTPVPVLRERRVSPARVTLVALGLVPAGAVAGFVAGALGVSIWVGVTEGVAHAIDPATWLVAGSVGAGLGAVLLPLAGFTVLRRAPLGKVLLETILGTALGGAIGAVLSPFGAGWFTGALAGFALSVGHLWWRARRR